MTHPVFHDIFKSKKSAEEKEKPKPRITIEADYREKNSLVFTALRSLGIDVEQKALPVADFLVNGVAIERKTVSDFISSMINKRIFQQLEEIKQYERYFLIIEGIEEKEIYDDEAEGGINPNAIRGMLLSIILKYQVPIIFTKNAEDTAKFIAVLANKKERADSSIRPIKKAHNPQEQKQYILEGFPGIGPTNAKKLLEKFHNLKNIFNASEEELKEILGIKSEGFKKIIDN